MKSSTKRRIILLAAFFLGAASSYFIQRALASKQVPADVFHLERLHKTGNHLVNPLMQVDTPSGGDARLESAKFRMRKIIDRAVENKQASAMSVYLRDLNKATWAGIGEDEKYTIASLAKVPIMFTFFIKAQKDPSILYKKIKYDKPINTTVEQYIAPKTTLQLGEEYSVDELVRHMIIYSDNTSLFLLANDQDIDLSLIDQLYTDLRLPVPQPRSEYEISPEDYGRYFRLLYGATYLNKDSSEKALKMLTQTDFNQGIVAGVPQNITVAHKFGERYAGVQGVELHDCGIIYYPNDPYLLCVMTKGWDLEILKNIIQEVSMIAYEEIDKPMKR